MYDKGDSRHWWLLFIYEKDIRPLCRDVGKIFRRKKIGIGIGSDLKKKKAEEETTSIFL